MVHGANLVARREGRDPAGASFRQRDVEDLNLLGRRLRTAWGSAFHARV